MRGRFEDLQPVARAETKEALESFLVRERVDSYKDDEGYDDYGQKHGFSKSFRKGGPLEWMNPPDRPECFQEVIIEEWIERTRRSFAAKILSLAEVS